MDLPAIFSTEEIKEYTHLSHCRTYWFGSGGGEFDESLRLNETSHVIFIVRQLVVGLSRTTYKDFGTYRLHSMATACCSHVRCFPLSFQMKVSRELLVHTYRRANNISSQTWNHTQKVLEITEQLADLGAMGLASLRRPLRP